MLAKIPRPKSWPGVFLWAVCGGALILAIRLVWLLVDANIEKLLEAHKLDTLLASNWSAIVRFLAENAFLMSVATSFLMGGALCMWAYIALSRLPLPRRWFTKGVEATTSPQKIPSQRPEGGSGAHDLATQPIQMAAEWGKVGSFELWQAAALWVDEPPLGAHLLHDSQRYMASYARLKAAILDDQLESVPPQGLEALRHLNGKDVTERTRVNRDHLVAFAKKQGERPTFLFGKDQPQPTKKQPLKARALGVSLESPKGSFSATNKRKTHSTCTLTIRSHADVPLQAVSVHLVELWDGDDLVDLSGPIRIGGASGAYSMTPRQERRFEFVTRDLRHAPVPFPFMLHMDSEDVPLAEGKRYRMRLEARSDFEHPTVVLLAVDTTDPEIASVKIEEQFVVD
ncbi:MAG: hypothetical protein ACK4RV_13865 [Caulobacter sp.]